MAHRIFGVAELLVLIFTHCDNTSLSRLACSSRSLFDLAIKVLWRNLKGVHKVLSLVSGAIDGRVKQNNPPPRSRPLSLDTVDFTRFNVYAPYVKSLSIYDPMDAKRRIVTHFNWGFIQYLSQLRVLLPNLRFLTMNHTRGNPVYEKWIVALASDGLRAVYAPLIADPGVLPYPPSIPLSAASIATAILVGKSSSVETLEIYPIASSAELNTIDQGGITNAFVDPPLASTPYQRFYSSLEGLRSLRKLSITAIALEMHTFRALANLPCLESLTIHNTSYQLPEFYPVPVSSTSFPALRILSLIDIDQANLERAWTCAPFVHQLCSLTVRWSYSGRMPVDWTRTTFIPLLRTCSPDLKEFLCEGCRPGRETEVLFKLGITDLKQ